MDTVKQILFDQSNIPFYMFCLEVLDKKYKTVIYDMWTTDKDIEEVKTINRIDTIFSENRKSFNRITFRYSDCVVFVYLALNGNITLYVSGADNVQVVFNELKEVFPVSNIESDQVAVNFWYNTNEGPQYTSRKLSVPKWSEIEDNYPDNTHDKISKLINHKVTDTEGKIILFTGNAGTGKTYSIRAIAREWSKWCTAHYVMDPESFFTDGSYLTHVALNSRTYGGYDYDDNSNSDSTDKRWRLIILEDTGEILTKDAKDREGQKLSRLLNMADGLLGQGARILFLITTNEDIGSLHAAVTRPGRCLAEIKFDKFNSGEAGKWLNNKGFAAVKKSQYTLAEMYAIANGDTDYRSDNPMGFDRN